MKFGKAVVKSRIAILIISAVLLVPSLLGMINTRVNYDMLNYLPDSLDTVKGQEYMLEDFGKGAFSFLIFENVNEKAWLTAKSPCRHCPTRYTTLSTRATAR